ncbi:glycosyltransferase family 4 protein [Candidatus Pollutiaquabacter sp.]|uniref:glycosyltransferase family 4 protein n=1 Tax=Candidatus Pollutiaquabacter sp. TaxID=3416354 RepID=UPI003CB9948B|nr:glycosyltransferase [Bacteroidota bacterium]
MEIIHLILGKANPDRMNGVNRAVHHLATSQAQNGLRVSVWGITPTPESAYPDGRQYATRLFRSRKNKLGLDHALSKALQEVHPGTVFHFHGGFIPEYFHAARLLTRKGVPYIFTPHGSYNTVALRKSAWMKKCYFPLFERFVLNHARAIHLLGHSEELAMQQLNTKARHHVVPNGQDQAELQHHHRELPRTQSPVFGFCGRIDAYTKGLDTLVSAFSDYAAAGNPGECWIIGDGPDRIKLEQQVRRLNLQDRIVFFGALYGEEKLNRIANMDVFLHPSRNEGLPTAVLEASGLGVPCIVSEETNVGSVVRRFNAGIVLEKNNVQSLKESLVRFRYESNRFSLSPLKENAKRMVEEEFDWRIIAHRLQALYLS